MSPYDFIMQIYQGLMEQSYKLNEIDDMDFYGYLDIFVYKSLQEEESRCTYIDQCGFL